MQDQKDNVYITGVPENVEEGYSDLENVPEQAESHRSDEEERSN